MLRSIEKREIVDRAIESWYQAILNNAVWVQQARFAPSSRVIRQLATVLHVTHLLNGIGANPCR